MNILVDRLSRLVYWYGASTPTVVDGVFFADGYKLGVPDTDAELIENVPAIDFYANALSYTDTWGVHNAENYADAVALTISTAKTAKRTQIEQDRDTACYANVTVNGHSWQADIRSQQMLASAILLAQAGVYAPDVWRDANNVDVPIASVAQLVEIAGAMAAQTQAAYSDSWARKQALDAATTVEDVEAV